MTEVIRSDFEKGDPGKSIALLDEKSDQRGGHNPILLPRQINIAIIVGL